MIQDIKANGGLIEPLIVREETLGVLEGNGRLAAYRYLAKQDPIKWGLVKCTMLPCDVSESLVFALLGEYHIKGKKDWAPYEQAGFLYRRYKQHNADIKALALEMNISSKKIKHLIDTYEFMVTHGEADTNTWSYYDIEPIPLTEAAEGSFLFKPSSRVPAFLRPSYDLLKKVEFHDRGAAVDLLQQHDFRTLHSLQAREEIVRARLDSHPGHRIEGAYVNRGFDGN